MLSTNACVSSTFNSKLRLCCISASFIGLLFFSGLKTDADVVVAKGPDKALSLRSKVNIKPKYKDEDNSRESHMNSIDELGSLGTGGDQVTAAPMRVRSIVGCSLLLFVMLGYVNSIFTTALPKDRKSLLQVAIGSLSKIIRGLGCVIHQMREMSPYLSSSPFFLYAMFVLFVIAAYLYVFKILEAQGSRMLQPEWSLFLSVSGEGFGILWLRQRIRQSKHAQGISAKSVAIFAMLYLDTACTFPAMKSQQLDIWACKVLEIVSFLLVVDVLYSILVTHRRTYQKELDVFPVVPLICVCAVLAFIYQPSRAHHHKTSVAFTFRIYVDTFALVPQVVMMSLQERPVHAPIAHFVGVNAMGRMIDLMYWMREFKFCKGPFNMSSSGWLICMVHVASLLVVADFFYYYVKTCIAKRGFIVDVPIPLGIDV